MRALDEILRLLFNLALCVARCAWSPTVPAVVLPCSQDPIIRENNAGAIAVEYFSIERALESAKITLDDYLNAGHIWRATT
jgi:hypothetical protein